jgi:hypothetical protein
VQNPTVNIPSNLLFLSGGNPGSITIGGGATTVAPSAVVAANGINPVLGIREYYTVADDVHWIKGKHSFSAGGWFQRLHQDQLGSAQFSAGGISYTTLLNFLTDVPSQFNLNRNPIKVGFRSWEAAWYVQDEIKLRSNLTCAGSDEFTNGGTKGAAVPTTQGRELRHGDQSDNRQFVPELNQASRYGAARGIALIHRR